MKKIIGSDRYNHVLSSLMFCSHALQEYRTLTNKYEEAVVNQFIRKAPFNFYKASLTYLIILEYCKLFNPKEIGCKMSNIMEFWEYCSDIYTCLTDETQCGFLYNLNEIERSQFLTHMKRLRNKTIAHSDYDPINKPFNISAFNQEEIDTIVVHLDNAIEILNRIAKLEDTTIVGFPHQTIGSCQTKNFIHYNAIATQFHDKNWELANKQGYFALQQKIIPTK